jgi:hypothetical protein
MTTKLRIAGWILFASGAGYIGFLISQGSIDWKDPWAVAAALSMPIGMGLTTLATVVGLVRQRLQGPQRPVVEAEPPPDPNKPVKTYKVRPLESEKLKNEEKKP